LDRTASADRRRRRGIIALNIALIVLCLGFGAVFSYRRGQDINFDQLNYHYYVAHAFWADRLSQDVAPAQIIHSYFNPVLYFPFYFMVRHFPPPAVGMVLGSLHALNFWLVAIILWIVTPKLRLVPRVAAVICGLAISAAGPMTISEIGTTMSDLLASLLILAGLALLLRADFSNRGTLRVAISIAIAGALLGASVSLKLTSASFAVAFAAAALVGWDSWRSRLIAIAATAFGGLLGTAAAGGFWYLRMWRMFHNPVLPFFNTIFKSPDYRTDASVFDDRFVPHGLLDALSYPFRWAASQHISSELDFRDRRFAILIVLAIAVIAIRVALRGQASDVSTRFAPAGRRLITFFVVAFCVWMYVWSIQRYIALLELLTGPALLVLLQWTGLSRRLGGLPLVAAAAGLAAVCVTTVQPTDWGHIAWGRTWFTVDIPPAKNEHPVYFLDGAPLSYVVPALQPGASVVEIIVWEDMRPSQDTVFVRRIKALLADPDNDVIRVIAAEPVSDSFRQTIASYGLQVADADCKTVPGRPAPLIWCPITRVGPSQ
jgi:uncharacterized integral membrane protein